MLALVFRQLIPDAISESPKRGSIGIVAGVAFMGLISVAAQRLRVAARELLLSAVP